MQISKTLAAAFAVAALTTIAGSPALASASDDAGFTYRASAPPANPHDLFRHNIKVPAPEAKTDMAMKDCGCPMMKAVATKSGHGG
ncbi:hypothetical protein B7G68_12925 [Caulobacter segnis]|uniref:Uncharacterized protein n=2 Tax=Caulobacter segnis TaxID=88688 RepID=D5VKF6_CAUST|nr:hypothetical protein [Caulobacter segnis]ADG10979.1 hypothetical protein Cseg_2525 [Caulobacter segnis ATCC 21756]AVQ02674.1 hypothetical protein B7G68_12925 [Caulobacter segnis]